MSLTRKQERLEDVLVSTWIAGTFLAPLIGVILWLLADMYVYGVPFTLFVAGMVSFMVLVLFGQRR